MGLILCLIISSVIKMAKGLEIYLLLVIQKNLKKALSDLPIAIIVCFAVF